ncbi:MAG: pyridoxine 5'-phosphate synthase [Chlorobi bacterium]|nr:pyridoxine 5'-phosphate synthase [Chlorobiota bacterium]
MAELAINVDHIATLREARGGIEPDPVAGAVIAELAGAAGIVCHLREDRRHISERDVEILQAVVKTKLNLEMAAAPDIIAFALKTLPDVVTLVPERREELTTEGGLDVAARVDYYTELVQRMHDKEIEVSFFIEPDIMQIDAAVTAGADIVELHTGAYANARSPEEVRHELDRLTRAAEYAHQYGLRVHAGHGLNYLNVVPIVCIPHVVEVSIGHAIIARAVFCGLDRAVREMCELVRH